MSDAMVKHVIEKVVEEIQSTLGETGEIKVKFDSAVSRLGELDRSIADLRRDASLETLRLQTLQTNRQSDEPTTMENFLVMKGEIDNMKTKLSAMASGRAFDGAHDPGVRGPVENPPRFIKP